MDGNSINQEPGLDTKLLSDFIYELNISRRCASSYPKGHPRVVGSAQKVLELLARLLELRDKITLGIAKDTLIVEGSFLDKKNPVYRDYAKSLFNLGIATLALDKNLTIEDFLHFNESISQTRDSLEEKGGIDGVLRSLRVKSIEVGLIDYDLFQIREGEPIVDGPSDLLQMAKGTLWEEFVLEILKGSPVLMGTPPSERGGLSPSELAQLLNSHQTNPSDKENSKEENYEKAITAYVRKIFEKERALDGRKVYFDKLGKFVKNLTPALRNLFLTDLFRSLATQKELPPDLAKCFPEEVILDAVAKIDPRNPYYPLIFNLLQRLAKIMGKEEILKPIPAETPTHKEDFELKLNSLLREYDIESLIPKSYQRNLQNLLSQESVVGLNLTELDDLKSTLSGHSVDLQISAIILEILKSGMAGENKEALERNLTDLCNYFLQIGEFEGLTRLYLQIQEYEAPAATDTGKKPNEVLKTFASPEFLMEVLGGLEIWGKTKYADIKALIRMVGAPFYEPLLTRLAEEPSLSIRRFFIECLQEIGAPIRDLVISRLNDKRWFFVRNLILILRGLADPSVLSAVSALRNHPHPRVREEVLKTLLQFKIPDADRMLLEALSSSDPETRQNAVQLAETSKNPRVFQSLLTMLQKGGLMGFELALKRKIIRTLAKIGHPDALPVLEGLLQGKNFLHGEAMSQLKGEIIKSLDQYPVEVSQTLLQKIRNGKDRQLAWLASKIQREAERRIPA